MNRIPSVKIKTERWQRGTYEIDEPIRLSKNTHVLAHGVVIVVLPDCPCGIQGHPDDNATIEGVTVRQWGCAAGIAPPEGGWKPV